MIRFLIIIPLTLLFGTALAQQDPQFSQYMFNNMSINPGYAGSKDAICLTGSHRIQWVGFPGAPNTSNFSVSAPFKPFKINSGIGFTATNDKYGFQNSPSASVSYAYIMNVKNGEGKLGIGVNIGFLSSTFDAKYNWGKGNTPETNIPGESSKESATTYDLGLGVYYRTENLYFGVSSTHITQSSYKFSQSNSTYTMERHYYITTGYNFALQNPSFEVQPSILLKYGGSSSIDLNALVLYNKRIWGGVSYRVSSAVIGLVGLELSNGIRVGYSYDFTINALNPSSHEIMLSYCFSVVKEKIPHKYRSVRFL